MRTLRPIGPLILSVACLACHGSERKVHTSSAPVTTEVVQRAALAALASAPWESDPSGWGALCTAASPCDTLIVEPRVIDLPAQAPAFFVPERRPVNAILDPAWLPLSQHDGHHLLLGAWRDCSARRDTPSWPQGHTACVALAVAGPETASGEAITFALLALTPAKGLAWPRVRVTRRRDVWQGIVVSNASE